MDREKQKRREDLGIRILQNCRNELYSGQMGKIPGLS